MEPLTLTVTVPDARPEELSVDRVGKRVRSRIAHSKRLEQCSGIIRHRSACRIKSHRARDSGYVDAFNRHRPRTVWIAVIGEQQLCNVCRPIVFVRRNRIGTCDRVVIVLARRIAGCDRNAADAAGSESVVNAATAARIKQIGRAATTEVDLEPIDG